MKQKVFAFLCACLLLPATLAAATPEVPSGPEQFQVNERTAVPNVTLAPGSYSIRILDHLRDRVILQVSSRSNHVETTFLAIPAATMSNAPTGPIPYSAGPKGKAALKGFAFTGGVAVEFVYPKNDAVSIAQANGTRVMAIDPASEGRKPAPKLSQNDMNMITLWMLEPSRVGPGDKTATIAATKYQAPVASAPVETAQASPAPQAAPAPVEPSTSSATADQAQVSAPVAPRPTPRRQRPVQLAQNDVPPAPAPVHHTRPANITSLPHTASDMPWLWLATLGSLSLGAGLSLRRRLTV